MKSSVFLFALLMTAALNSYCQAKRENPSVRSMDVNKNQIVKPVRDSSKKAELKKSVPTNKSSDEKALNPQPLPPKEAKASDKKALNPQPLPPKENKLSEKKVSNQIIKN